MPAAWSAMRSRSVMMFSAAARMRRSVAIGAWVAISSRHRSSMSKRTLVDLGVVLRSRAEPAQVSGSRSARAERSMALIHHAAHRQHRVLYLAQVLLKVLAGP